MRDSILLTGGTGTTGRRISAALKSRGALHRVATRSPQTRNDVQFEWADDTTWTEALDRASSVYLVAPSGVPDPLRVMEPFLRRAINDGVERFVLLSASSLESGGPMMGSVHAWLSEHAPEWAVLRPTWFMQNFCGQQHLASIRDESAIYTATEEGRIGFIDAEDIAAVAVEFLTRTENESGDVILTGPQALSYDDVAHELTTALGRRVQHCRLSETELASRHMSSGLPRDYAETLSAMDTSIAAGSENRITDSVESITGRPARTLAAFIVENVAAWRTD
ncbi:MAG: ergot alkaloid biosynthesis protein [Pseudomonadota bacterium]